MKDIIHKALSDAFDIFLGWALIELAAGWAKKYFEFKTRNKRTHISTRERLIAYIVWFLIAAAAGGLVFLMRVVGLGIYPEDYVYSLTGFFIILFSSYIRLYISYRDYKPENKKF